MNNKNIILVGAIAIGLYLFSQGKSIFSAAAQKVDISKLPVQQLRYLIAHAAALGKTGKEVAALKAEEARRVARWKVAQKLALKRIGQPTTQAARIAALRKAAVRKAAAQKIGKIIGKKVAQKVAQKGDISGVPVAQIRYTIAHAAALGKTGKEVAALKAEEARRVARWKAAVKKKKNEVAKKEQIRSKLFPGSEKSRVIPYSESSKHSYYGPKSHKVLNEGYMEKRYKADQKQAQEQRLDELRAMFPLDEL